MSELVELLRERNKLLDEMLAITLAEDFSNKGEKALEGKDEELVNRVAWLYTRRAGLMETVGGVNKRLEERGVDVGHGSVIKGGAAAGFEAELEAGRKTAAALAAADAKHKADADALMDRIKAKLKELNGNRAAAMAYHNESGLAEHSLYDKSN